MVNDDNNSKKQKLDDTNRQEDDVANQTLHDIIPNNEGILINVKADDIVEVEMPYTLKAFSMFHYRGVICSFTKTFLMINWVGQWLNAMVGRK